MPPLAKLMRVASSEFDDAKEEAGFALLAFAQDEATMVIFIGARC